MKAIQSLRGNESRRFAASGTKSIATLNSTLTIIMSKRSHRPISSSSNSRTISSSISNISLRPVETPAAKSCRIYAEWVAHSGLDTSSAIRSTPILVIYHSPPASCRFWNTLAHPKWALNLHRVGSKAQSVLMSSIAWLIWRQRLWLQTASLSMVQSS